MPRRSARARRSAGPLPDAAAARALAASRTARCARAACAYLADYETRPAGSGEAFHVLAGGRCAPFSLKTRGGRWPAALPAQRRERRRRRHARADRRQGRSGRDSRARRRTRACAPRVLRGAWVAGHRALLLAVDRYRGRRRRPRRALGGGLEPGRRRLRAERSLPAGARRPCRAVSAKCSSPLRRDEPLGRSIALTRARLARRGLAPPQDARCPHWNAAPAEQGCRRQSKPNWEQPRCTTHSQPEQGAGAHVIAGWRSASGSHS